MVFLAMHINDEKRGLCNHFKTLQSLFFVSLFHFCDPLSRQVSGEIFLSVTWVYPTIEGRGRETPLWNSAVFLDLPNFFRSKKPVHMVQKDHR